MSAPRTAPSRRAGLLALAAALAATPAARAAGEYLVQDLGQELLAESYGFQFPLATTRDGVAYFYLNDGIHGRELWRSDGSALGTYLVRDICPGICGSDSYRTVQQLATSNGGVYFAANDGIHGVEPWITDGSVQGTRMIADLFPGPNSSDPDLFTAALGEVYFAADDGVHGAEIWRTDGTSGGTELFQDVPTNAAPRALRAAASQLYFTRDDGSLHRTDGTTPGTVSLLIDAGVPGWSGWLRGAPLLVLGPDLLLFEACQQGGPGVGDCELWRSDGTVPGTYRLADLAPGPSSSGPIGFFRVGGAMYFMTGEESLHRLFRSDGTVGGTVEITLPPGTQPWTHWGTAAAVGNRLFFTACDAASGCEPWVTDGASSGRVADLAPGPGSSIQFGGGAFASALFVEIGGAAVFLADDGVDGLRLWASDGTAAGTSPIGDFGTPPPGATFPFGQSFVEPMVSGAALILPLLRPDSGLELWSSDGSVSGTTRIVDLPPQFSAFVPAFLSPLVWSRRQECFAPLRQGVILSAEEEASDRGSGFYFADGVPQGAVRLGDSFDVLASEVPSCAAQGNRVIAFGGKFTASGIWSLDGNSANTSLLHPTPFTTSNLGPPVVALGTSAFVGVPDQLIRVDSGSQVTSYPSTISWGAIETSGELLYFGGSPGLEVTDGESAPVVLIPEALPPDQIGLDDLSGAAGSLFFSLGSTTEGPELWVSDGSIDGTYLVRDVRSGPLGGIDWREIREYITGIPKPRIAALAPSLAVFAADDGASGNELWRSDGTEEGTQLLLDLAPGPQASWPRQLTRDGALAYFVADHPLAGVELFRTDGTATGTHLLRDLVPGIGSSVPEELTVQDGILYFSAWTPEHGREAWRSDGTSAGTWRLTDVAPGPLSSSPRHFVRRGDRLFFVATDQIHGFELWARADDGSVPIFIDGVETEDTSRWSAVAP